MIFHAACLSLGAILVTYLAFTVAVNATFGSRALGITVKKKLPGWTLLLRTPFFFWALWLAYRAGVAWLVCGVRR